MLIKLSIVLIALILIFCGNKGAKSIATTVINISVLALYIYLIYKGVNPALVTIPISIIFIYSILIYQNEEDIKARIALASVISVIILIIPLVYILSQKLACHGISEFQYEITDSNGYTRNIGINMLLIQNSILIISLIGIMCDTAMAISSSIFEINKKTISIDRRDMIKASDEISRYVLSTSIHTIFYIYMAEFMTLIMQFVKNMSFSEMLNSSSFAEGILSITISGCGSLLVIPITRMISIYCIENNIERIRDIPKAFKNSLC